MRKVLLEAFMKLQPWAQFIILSGVPFVLGLVLGITIF